MMSRADRINNYIARGGIVRLRADGPDWRTITAATADPAISAWTLVMFEDGTVRTLRGDDQDSMTLEYAPGPDFKRGEETI
jgi:hypothetical protein